MTQQEFNTNQTFKYPEEYDIYAATEQEPCKIQKADKAGLKDYGTLYDAGIKKKDEFLKEDTDLHGH